MPHHCQPTLRARRGPLSEILANQSPPQTSTPDGCWRPTERVQMVSEFQSSFPDLHFELRASPSRSRRSLLTYLTSCYLAHRRLQALAVASFSSFSGKTVSHPRVFVVCTLEMNTSLRQIDQATIGCSRRLFAKFLDLVFWFLWRNHISNYTPALSEPLIYELLASQCG